jgi:hypothetical protein
MLYFIFTIDGDWEEYFNTALPEEKRLPDKQRMLSLIGWEIKLASDVLNGRFIHFVHTSPRARDFFLQPEFILKWREIEGGGGNVGVHCHEDDPQLAYYHNNPKKMEESIDFLAGVLDEKGLKASSFRGGYMGFSPTTIPILEENGIFLDFSCAPGRYLRHGDLLVSDWRGAPENFYRMSYEDHRRPGKSRVFEIPLGIYIETTSLLNIWKKARELRKRQGDTIVSVLAHSYDFKSSLMRIKMKLALLILKNYGKFINAEEALEKISRREGD